MNKKLKIIFGLILVLILVGGFKMLTASKEYQYDVNVASAGDYSVLLDFNHNYFTNQANKIVMAFTSFGGPPMEAWGGGEQATPLGLKQELPYKITVRYFSIPENQFWEGSAILDQEKLKQLENYKINNIITGSYRIFLENFTFYIAYAPGGLVTVWIFGGGEQYVVAQFKAHKIEEPNWDRFVQGVFGEQMSRKRYLADQMAPEKFTNFNRVISEKIRKEILEHKVPGSEPWLRLMNKYSWVLKTNNLYELKDYKTTYANGEQYYSYQNQDQTKPRAVPISLITFIRDKKTHKDIRLDYEFNQNEIIDAFEKLAKETGPEPIQLYLDIDEKLSKVDLYLIKDSQKIEIKKVEISRNEVFSDYKPSVP
ncbi:DUF2931 family protein [Commensalibacter nepenthis]|uniref:DUF2931 family protein n=1 Tax=Commensalibacter nepenthis TaxID=3043872 RepID=A0ABT6Q4D7_9PROT|nr:DUF2931 family protein [Commensalibacter sp. TBRC 10068]MDI2111754.1 DUF2931 family protein [Commensalibacter sp. TBRC 10068]